MVRSMGRKSLRIRRGDCVWVVLNSRYFNLSGSKFKTYEEALDVYKEDIAYRDENGEEDDVTVYLLKVYDHDGKDREIV